MSNISKCSKKFNDKIIKVKEVNSSFVIENPDNKDVIKISVDDCLEFEGKKCDYFFDIIEQKQFFVELKGSDYKKGLKQVESTYNFFKKNYLLKEVYFFIITSHFPKETTTLQINKKRLKKEGITLKVKNRKLIVKIQYGILSFM